MRPEKREHPDHTGKIRAFIAVEISEDLKSALQRLQKSFEAARGRVTWVKPAGMHITLKFLGEIEESKIPEIGRQIRGACTGCAPFPVRFLGAGVFPDMKRPRVLWCGIGEGAEQLKEIFSDLDPRLSQIGFPREKRPFRPHITLGRIKEILDRQGFRSLIDQNRETEVGAMVAASIHLIESRLRPDGAVYGRDFLFPLGMKGVRK